MMKFRILLAFLLILGIATAAYAAEPKVKPSWWPGEKPWRDNVVVGKVTAVSPDSITLATPKGPATFVVTSETRVVVRGVKTTIADVKVDDPAGVHFKVAEGGARIALAIRVPKPTYAGKITAINGNVITLQGKEKTWYVTLTPQTKIRSQQYVGTLNDLRVGYFAAAQGPAEGDNITAEVLTFRPTVLKGEVAARNGAIVTVRSIRGKDIAVTVTDATYIQICPRTAKNYRGSLNDVKVGTAVNVGGHATGENTMTALWMDLLVTGPPQGGAPGARPIPKIHRKG